MAILSISIDKTQNVPLLLGGTNSFLVRIKNLSSSIYLYNLNIAINTPDGITVESGSEPITSTVSNADGSKVYSWVNIKDLAPLEVDYTFKVTIKGTTTFQSGTTIPFGYIFNGFSVICKMDTKPRGNYDIGNQIETGTVTMTYKAVRYKCIITTAGKVLKGAGTSMALTDYTKTATASCTFVNNGVSVSGVNTKILLPNGIRYIGNINVTGSDASQFLNPTITTIVIDGKVYTQIYFGGITMSLNGSTTVTFTYAVWNRYDENIGGIILNGTSFSILASVYNLDEIVEESVSFLAMDIIITCNISLSFIDVGDILGFDFDYLIGGYYDIQDIVINYLMPDGTTYISSSVTPYTVVDDPTLKGYYLTYHMPLALRNSSSSVSITGQVDVSYRYKTDGQGNHLPVVSFDSFRANDDVAGLLVGTQRNASDSASDTANISIAEIQKTFLGGYYKNNTPKTIAALAPGDLAEYRLTYTASTLNAIQKSINMYDFFPLAAGPIDGLSYAYTGYHPVGLQGLPIDPHGVNFNYGNIPGNELITITYKVPINAIGSPADNNNLFKFSGVNTEGYSYSSRTQVLVNIATPNLQLTKNVSGPNINAVKAGEVYNYTVTITNNTTSTTGTDAFNFNLSDTLSTWFTVNPASITVTGTGTHDAPVLNSGSIDMSIIKLAPGQTLTLAYSVTIISTLAPNLTITTTATNTNPYSQLNDPTSFQYTDQVRTASTTLKSQNVSVNKVANNDVFKIGSLINYTITVTVPLGTIAYDVNVVDTLPSGNQTFISATKNGNTITPTVVNNVITMPNEATVDATSVAQTIVYVVYCKIIDGTKPTGVTTITQTNNYKCNYKRTVGGTVVTINKNLNVTINVPNIVLNLYATDTTTAITYTSTGNIKTSSSLLYKLEFTNNSAIRLVNGIVELLVSTSLDFVGFNLIYGCTAAYDNVTRKITINIPSLNAAAKGFILFTANPLPLTVASTVINSQATAIEYYNDIYTKVYGGETSNFITLKFAPGVGLLPEEAYKVNDSTSFRISQPGSRVTILNYFTNTGGGFDSFTTALQSVKIPYDLYIDDVFITTVPANTSYSANLAQMANLQSGATKIIKVVTQLPADMPLGTRYDFVVTTTSLTSPYPSKTVTNIDPKI